MTRSFSRIRRLLKRLMLALPFVSTGAGGAPPPPASDPAQPIDRVAEIRQRLLAADRVANGAERDTPGGDAQCGDDAHPGAGADRRHLAQWRNWKDYWANWPNWNNWANWSKWPNF